jgi:hypothetical protein
MMCVRGLRCPINYFFILVTCMSYIYVSSFLELCVIFIYYYDSNLIRMRELYEGQDDCCCEKNFYKGDHHVLGHTISLMN